MGITVEELISRLNAEANRRGLSPVRLLEQLSANLHKESETVGGVAPASMRHIAFAGVGASHGTLFARDLDNALAEGFGRP